MLNSQLSPITKLVVAFSTGLVGFTIFVACSSTPKSNQAAAQASKYLHFATRSPASLKCEEPGCTWVSKYREALTNLKEKKPELACESFIQLSEQQNFSLKLLSLARAFSSCPSSITKLPTIDSFTKLTFPPWSGDIQMRSALARSQNTHDEFSEYKISVQIVTDQLKRKTAPQSENEKLARRSIEILHGHANDEGYKKIATEDLLNERLYEISPRLNPNPQKEKLWLAAKDFEKSKLDFSRARSIYKKIFDTIEKQSTKSSDDIEVQFRALDAIRYDYKLERNSDHAALFEAAKRGTEFCLKYLKQKGRDSVWSANYVKASLQYASHLWTYTKTDGSTKLAIKILDDGVANLKIARSEYSTDDLLLMRARIADEQGETELALKLLQNIGRDTKDDDKRDQMLWTKAFIYYKLQRYSEAAQAFTDMIPSDPKEHNSRAHFWRGESFKQLAARDTASTSLTKALNMSLPDFNWLIENEPFGYYGLVASHELKMAFPSIESVRKTQHEKKKSEERPSGLSSPFETAELFETSQLLINVKETEFERKLLDQTSQKMSGSKTTTTQNWVDLLKLYAQAEQYQNLFENLAGMPLETRTQIFADNPELVFPTEPYTVVAQTTAQQLGVRWEFVFSIMRQESSLNPMARSPANAFGLLQLIPENAIAVSGDVGIHLDTHKDQAGHLVLDNPEILFDPNVNIPLGTALMKRLFKKNQNNFIKTVAGYNSSPAAIDGWIRSRYHGDILAFIDDIPYEETKTYIKTVMRNYIYYSRLETPSVDVEFPAWCLEGFPIVSQ